MSATTPAPPLPPDELIDRVMGGFSNERADYRGWFLLAGQPSPVTPGQALAAVSDTLSAHRRILDSSCGCGRVVRWMEDLAKAPRLVGTGVDAGAIEWASWELSFAQCHLNDPLRLTRHSDGVLDLVVKLDR